MDDENHKHHFYGKPVLRYREQDFINSILSKYKDEPVNEALKEKIWNDLQMAKSEGRITIPFKIAMRRDIYGLYPEYVEVILDTKL